MSDYKKAELSYYEDYDYDDPYEGQDSRKMKKSFGLTTSAGAVDMAMHEGAEAATYGENRPNHYPPGIRHDAWEEGNKSADPMGDYHGSNY